MVAHQALSGLPRKLPAQRDPRFHRPKHLCTLNEGSQTLVDFGSSRRILGGPGQISNEHRREFRQVGEEQILLRHRGAMRRASAMNNDLVYLDRRASEERSAARKSVHANTREIHLELAQAYEFRVFLLKQMDAGGSAPLHFDIGQDQPSLEPRRIATGTEGELGPDRMTQEVSIPV